MREKVESLIKSIFGSRNENRQSTSIRGDNNTVHQTFIVNTNTSPDKSNLLIDAHKTTEVRPESITIEASENDESPEIQKILQYRKIADNGDANTALKLLNDLASQEAYSEGYLSFRLHFNIGVVYQNIGELAQASEALNLAHTKYPESDKSKTAKSFADLIDGKYQDAFDQSSTLAQITGDHQILATTIFFHSAKQLSLKVEREILSKELLESNLSVIVAELEYLRVMSPETYKAALNQAYQSHKDEQTIATFWALNELDDIKRNQAFMLGAKMPDTFEIKVSECAKIFQSEIDSALKRNPPNMLQLPFQANNAAVALRLSGNALAAHNLIERVINTYPNLGEELKQVRASLLLQQDKDDEALALIEQSETHPELQIMASELEAMRGHSEKAIERVNNVINSTNIDELRIRANITKAQISIRSSNQESADQAIEDLRANAQQRPELIHLQSAYDRVFNAKVQNNEPDQHLDEQKKTNEEEKILKSLSDADKWDFITILQVADELFARGCYRECANLLHKRVSLSQESPALSRFCDATIEAGLGTLAQEISESMNTDVKRSVFGIKFDVNVAYLNGEISKAIPLTRKLFENNPKSITSLERYIQSLLRNNDHNRIRRIVSPLKDEEMLGTIDEQRSYVNLLVFCGEIARARKYAYRLYCHNQNDHRAWFALSASFLTHGQITKDDDRLSQGKEVCLDCTVELKKPNGVIQTYTIETDKDLIPLRDVNIAPDHPIATAILGKKVGDLFDWPIAKLKGQASIVSIKHKTLSAFHYCLSRFEEQFPNVAGFKSVSVNFEDSDGLNEMKSLLKQRSDYTQEKAQQYNDSHYPINILAYHLGIDPIDAFLSLKSECGFSPKVTSCTTEEQNKAHKALDEAQSNGIICDATVCYLLLRLDLADAVTESFGSIGITQDTIDIFANRLRNFETSTFLDSETKEKKAGRLAMRNDQLIMTEQSEKEIEDRLAILRSDLNWLNTCCTLVPAVAKTDPANEIIEFRQNEGGKFFDDIFGSDGTDRILISEDYHVRLWAEKFFGVQSAWLQALIQFLEEKRAIDAERTVTSTLELIAIGEHALTTNSARITIAAKMWATGNWSEQQFKEYCSILGQTGADFLSHWDVGFKSIRAFWNYKELSSIKEKATSLLLRNLMRIQPDVMGKILDAAEENLVDVYLREYLRNWRIGHFIT